MTSSDADDRQQWRTWLDAARTDAVDRDLRTLYDDLSTAIDQRGPTCWASGRCCNFEQFGHRLYVTGLEIAWVVHAYLRQRVQGEPTGQLSPTWSLDQRIDARGDCPFQVGKLCGVHAIRPLGCRVFFCQEGTQDWQHDLYEQFLGRLRNMHDERGLPYAYMEWRAGLESARKILVLDRDAAVKAARSDRSADGR